MGQLLAQRPTSAFICGPDRCRAELKKSVRARYVPMSAARVLYLRPLISPSRRMTCGGSARKEAVPERSLGGGGGQGKGSHSLRACIRFARTVHMA